MKSASPNRFGTFFSRVETEREVLSIINSFDSGPKLHGLTAVAIDRWATAVGGTAPGSTTPAEEEIVRLLHRIAIRADAHSDQSRVVFADEQNVTLPIHDLVERLRTLCRSRRRTSSLNEVNQCVGLH